MSPVSHQKYRGIMHYIIQTLILDCCHSAGANRKFRNAKARLIVDPPPIPANCDDTIWSNIPTRGASVSIGFVGQDRESHVLLAACSRDEGAWEHEGRGLFTRALLKVLTGVSSNTLDYATLIRKLEDFSEFVSDLSLFTSMLNEAFRIDIYLTYPLKPHTATVSTSTASCLTNMLLVATYLLYLVKWKRMEKSF